MIAIQLQFKDVPDPRSHLEVVGDYLFGSNKTRALKVFDKFDGVGWGQECYRFFITTCVGKTEKRVLRVLEKLEEIFNKHGKESPQEIGQELFWAVQDFPY